MTQSGGTVDWDEARKSVDRVIGSLHSFADKIREIDEDDQQSGRAQ